MISKNKGYCLSRISEGYSFQKCLAIVPPISHVRIRRQLPFVCNYFCMTRWMFVYIGKSKNNQTNANKISSQLYLIFLTIEILPCQSETMDWNEENPFLQILSLHIIPVKMHCFFEGSGYCSLTPNFHPVIQSSTNFVDFVPKIYN